MSKHQLIVTYLSKQIVLSRPHVYRVVIRQDRLVVSETTAPLFSSFSHRRNLVLPDYRVDLLREVVDVAFIQPRHGERRRCALPSQLAVHHGPEQFARNGGSPFDGLGKPAPHDGKCEREEGAPRQDSRGVHTVWEEPAGL